MEPERKGGRTLEPLEKCSQTRQKNIRLITAPFRNHLRVGWMVEVGTCRPAPSATVPTEYREA